MQAASLPTICASQWTSLNMSGGPGTVRFHVQGVLFNILECFSRSEAAFKKYTCNRCCAIRYNDVYLNWSKKLKQTSCCKNKCCNNCICIFENVNDFRLERSTIDLIFWGFRSTLHFIIRLPLAWKYGGSLLSMYAVTFVPWNG